MLKSRDIVIIGLQPWYYEIGSNCKNIALHFARHNRVLYVNLPLNRKTYLSSKKSEGISEHCRIIKEKGNFIKQIGNNMWELYPSSIVESINWLPSTGLFRVFNFINNRRFAGDIKKAMKTLDFRNIILFNDNDIFNGFYLKKLLSPSLYIYYCRDFLQGYEYWRKHCTELEPELMGSSDVVTANSVFLSDYGARYNRNSFYIGQGCNLELFDPGSSYAMPEEMKDIAQPVIGYVGAIISQRIDSNVIEAIARHNSSWNIVLVGPEDEYFRNSGLHRLPNVHFIGRKPMDMLPAFISSFTVCINPQLLNEITAANYPLKVDEYLSMGKPVIATLTATMQLFAGVTYLATSAAEYPALIEKAIAENSAEKIKERVSFAKQHTWENSMDLLYGVIEKMESLN